MTATGTGGFDPLQLLAVDANLSVQAALLAKKATLTSASSRLRRAIKQTANVSPPLPPPPLPSSLSCSRDPVQDAGAELLDDILVKEKAGATLEVVIKFFTRGDPQPILAAINAFLFVSPIAIRSSSHLTFSPLQRDENLPAHLPHLTLGLSTNVCIPERRSHPYDKRCPPFHPFASLRGSGVIGAGLKW